MKKNMFDSVNEDLTEQQVDLLAKEELQTIKKISKTSASEERVNPLVQELTGLMCFLSWQAYTKKKKEMVKEDSFTVCLSDESGNEECKSIRC